MVQNKVTRKMSITQHPLLEEPLLDIVFPRSNMLNVVFLYTLLYKARLGCSHPIPRLP